jgi:hypothetical protein
MRRSENISIMRPKRCQACGKDIRHIAARYTATEPGEDLIKAYWHTACADAIDAARDAGNQGKGHPADVEAPNPRGP